MTDAKEMRGSSGQYPLLNDPHAAWGKFYNKRGINIWCNYWMGWAEFGCKGCDKKMGWYGFFEYTDTANHLKAVYDRKILGAPTQAGQGVGNALPLYRGERLLLYRETRMSLLYIGRRETPTLYMGKECLSSV